ncbi:MAG: hypothetical protein FIB01_09705 [Gemmatimonadetes bacterium]|nr:hypothetical protein [Gemmatimonadota bacterium]
MQSTERSGPDPDGATSSPARSRPPGWVLAVVIGLVLVALVNFAFIYIAVSDADQVVPSYLLEHR